MSEFENNCFLYLKTTSVLHCIALQWVFFSAAFKTSIRSQGLEIPSRRKACMQGPDSPKTFSKRQSFEHCCSMRDTSHRETDLTERDLFHSRVGSVKPSVSTFASQWTAPGWEKHRIILLQLLGKPVGDIMPRVDPAHVHHDCSQLVLQRRWFKIYYDSTWHDLPSIMIICWSTVPKRVPILGTGSQ